MRFLPCTLLWLVVWTLYAAAVEPLPPVIERYEQMLVRTPAKGTAFEKVYQHFFEGPGVERLAARWQELAEANPDSPQVASYYLLRGLLADRQGHADEAAGFFTKVTELKPGDYAAYVALGDLHLGAGKLLPAIAAFQKALASGAPPDVRPRLFRQLARSQQRAFDLPGALATWQQFVAENPEDPFVLEEAGEALAEAERFPEARALFEKFRDSAGTNTYQRVRALLKLAQLEEQQGKIGPAREIYESALPLAAETSWIHREVRSRIEELFRRQDDLPGLTAYYTQWLEKHGKDVEAALRLSATLIELNKKTEAVEWLRRAAEWAPDRQEVQLALARRLGETGLPAEAVKILTRLVQARPEEPNLHEQLGEAQWLVFEKDKDEAARSAALASWGLIAPPGTKDPAWVSRLGDLLRQHRQADLALVEYRRAIELAPTVTELRERLVEYLFEIDRPTEAWKEVEALASGANPDYVRLARLQIRHRANDWALVIVEQGLAKQPGNFDLLIMQWDLLAEVKRWPEALALFERLSEAAPSSYFLDDIEGRHLLALSAAGEAEKFRTERVTKFGTGQLTERDLRLLARQALSGGDLEIVRKALEEGRVRLPDSFPLARLEVEYARAVNDLPARVRGLRRLIELQPKRRSDFLVEIVGAYRAESRWDDALTVVQEYIATAPAKAEGHVLQAEILLQADRFDSAVGKLREAIKLSDNPNGLRQRLAKVYFEVGQTAKAREVLDEAFEAAEKPNDRLALMQALTEAYFADGKLDILIDRFRQRQRGEDEGWRYALYLAEIFKQTLDHGSARRELARALAARPRDSGLLRQMVKLCTEEGNRAEVARYQELLTEAEPSDGNQVALIEALLEANQGEAACDLWQRQFAAIKRVNGSWERLFPLFARQGLLGRINDLILNQPGARHSLETMLQLGAIQVANGQLEEARQIFWQVFATPSAPPAAAAPPSGPLAAGGYQMSPFDQRMSNAYRIHETVARTLEPRQTGSTSYSMGPGVIPGVVDPADTARDTALMYLAGIAVRQEKAGEFLTELDRQMDARKTPILERLVTYSIVQSKQSLWNAVMAQARTGTPSPELDSFCMGQLMNLVQSNQYEQEKLKIDQQEAMELLAIYQHRMSGGTRVTASNLREMNMYFYRALGQQEKVRELRQQILKEIDFAKPERMLEALPLAMAEGDFPLVQKICAAVAEAAQKKGAAVNLQQYLQWLPNNVLNSSEPSQLTAEQQTQVLGEVLKLWYPQTVPRPGLGSTAGTPQYWQGNNDLPATRFFDSSRISVLAQVGQNLGAMRNGDDGNPGAAGRLEAVRLILAEQGKTLEPAARRIFPRMVLIYFDAWSGKTAEAAKEAQALLAENPADDDLRVIAGALLGKNRQFAEALTVLESVPARFGQANIDLQKQILAYAKLAGNDEAAKKAALRLVSLRLTGEDRNQLAAYLREWGLNDKASAVSRGSSAPAGGRGGGVLSNENYWSLSNATKEKRRDDALPLARLILGSDPLQMVQNQYLVDRALQSLLTFGQLETFIEETTAALEKSPDSLRGLYLLANAWQLLEAPGGRTIEGPVAKLPCWLKLERKGVRFTASHSADGKTWTEVGSLRVELPAETLAGLALVGREKDLETWAEFSDLALTPALPEMTWTPRVIGRLQKPGHFDFTAETGTYKLYAGAGWLGFEADALYFHAQPLSGDGTLVARFLAANGEKGFGEAGVQMRASADPKAGSVSLVAVPGQKVRLKFRSIDMGHAEAYWRRVAELRPDEMQFQKALALWLVRTGKNAEALTLFNKMVATNSDSLMQMLTDVTTLFAEAKQLPELANLVIGWKPSPKGNQNWNWQFVRFAEKLESEKQLALAERVCQHGIEVSESNDDDDLYRRLYRVQRAQGKTEEARKTLLTYFIPKTNDSTKGSSQPSLGFQSMSGRYVDTRPRWINSISAGSNGVEFGCREMVEMAAREGMMGDVLAAVQKTGTNDQSVSIAPMTAYVKIAMRDTAGIEEVRKLLAQKFSSNSAVILVECARSLESWPGQAPFALEIYRALRPTMEADSFLAYGRNAFLFDTAQLEEILGDPALPETLRTLAKVIEEDHIMGNQNNRASFNWSDAEKCLTWFLRTGMETEYMAFLEKMKKTPEGANIAWTYEEERKVFVGDAPKQQLMLWPSDPAKTIPGQPTEYRFEIRREHPYDHGTFYKYVASRGRSIAALEKERQIQFLYGPTPQGLAPLAAKSDPLSTPSANGVATFEMPAGGGWMTAVVVEKDAAGVERKFQSPLVPVSGGANLILNPSFAGLAERGTSGPFDLTGWKQLPAGNWGYSEKAPTVGAALRCRFRDGEEKVLTGERIRIESGKTYLQAVWLRPLVGNNCSVDAGRRFLDAEGKVLKTSNFKSFSALNWRWHGQRLLPVANPAEADAEVIPVGTMFVEPLLRIRGGAEVAGFYLGDAS